MTPVAGQPMNMTFAKEDVAVIVATNQGRELFDALAATNVIEVAAIFQGFEAAQCEFVVAGVGQQAVRGTEVVGGVTVHFKEFALRRLIDTPCEHRGLVNERGLPHGIQIWSQKV